MPIRWIGLLFLLGACVPASPACPAIPESLAQRLQPGHVVLIGEIHGTQQMPAQFANLVCHAREKDLVLKVGLELPSNPESGVAQWLHSAGGPDDQTQLTQQPFWRSDYQDGRASRAMYALLAELHRNKSDLDVFTFDRQVPRRDHAMAQRILEEVSDDSLTLILTGNIHSQTGVGTPWDATFETMGSVIKAQHPNTIGINLRHTGGSAWICAPECGERKLSGSAVPADGVFVPANGPHDWNWWIGSISTSRPAVER